MMAIDDLFTNLVFIMKWLHIFAGIIWIGHLYFFNFVNVPLQGVLDKEVKPKVNPLLLPRALWWFRWGAMFTFVVGWLLFFYKYMHGNLLWDSEGAISARAMWILYGGLLGTVMFINVWFIIWPCQKKIIGWVKKGESPSEMPALAKRALLASRTNVYLSGPMLFAMVAANNYSAISWPTLVIVTLIGLASIWVLVQSSSKVGQSV